MDVRQDIETTFTASFGRSRTGKAITVTVLDSTGSNKSTGFTAGADFELGQGFYGVAITFEEEFTGFVKFDNTTDDIQLYIPIVVTDDLTKVRKVETNRWKITDNQMIIYDDDGTTALITFDLKKNGAANDGTDPDERAVA